MSSTPTGIIEIRRAVVSVSDKALLEDLCRTFKSLGIEIAASSGTSAYLKKHKVNHKTIEEAFGVGEAFDGLVKTFSHEIACGILFDRSNPRHVEEAQNSGLKSIDCVVTNFYPFTEAVAKGKNEESFLAEMDIGGTAMARSAAKNCAHVLVVTDPADYQEVIMELKKYSGGVSYELRRKLMVKALERLFMYDLSILESIAGSKLEKGGKIVTIGKTSPVNWDELKPFGARMVLTVESALRMISDTKDMLPPGYGVSALFRQGGLVAFSAAQIIEDAINKLVRNSEEEFTQDTVLVTTAHLGNETIRLIKNRKLGLILCPGIEESAMQELFFSKNDVKIVKYNFDGESKPDFSRRRNEITGGILTSHFRDLKKPEFKNLSSTKLEDGIVIRTAFILARTIGLDFAAVIDLKSDESVVCSLIKLRPDPKLDVISLVKQKRLIRAKKYLLLCGSFCASFSGIEEDTELEAMLTEAGFSGLLSVLQDQKNSRKKIQSKENTLSHVELYLSNG